jgi:hypothetical protein
MRRGLAFGGALLLCLAVVVPASAAVRRARNPARTSDATRIAVFFEPGFPAIDTAAPDVADLRPALAGLDVSVLDSAALQQALDAERVDVLVLPFGSAFPQSAWRSIFRFLSDGGSFVNLGGVPFAVPVVREKDGWRAATRTTSYHKQLGIVQAFPVTASSLKFRAVEEDDAVSVSLAGEARAERIFELVVRFTTTKTFRDEDGSDGPREARLVPLVHGFGTGQLPVAAPLVQIDRLEGRFAGGRWVLATGDLGVSPRSAAALVARAAEGPAELTVQPRYAGFHPGEAIEVTVSLRRPGRTPDADVHADVQLLDKAGRLVASTPAPLAVSGPLASAEITLPIDSAGLPRGLYQLKASVPVPSDSAVRPSTGAPQRGCRAGDPARSGRTVGSAQPAGRATSGFWIYDEAALRGGRAIAAGRDYFTRDGVPFPVAGTTYMASDVHRRFLLEPNPWIWERDFSAMSLAGVNLVRTGIWTGWTLHSESDGRPTEAVLRALEVFLLTARQHEIPIIFNLFAFTPPTWGGRNPYFDPRALDAQRRFAGTIASRLAGANDIIWDLINEPSFSSPARLWQCRPNYDADEQAAWEAWLRETVAAPDDAAREALLHERWNSVPGEGLKLPSLQDFGDRNLFGLARPNKAADYRRFAQDAFRRWVRDMSSAIRANGNAAQLVTVGQDEGGAGERPNPLLFGDAVDFTGTHTWWNNDALLWDAVMSKRPDRPSLIEETGLMTYERPDGTAWRSEDDASNLLERKIALAFASGGAGFVQWLWNTNVYMPLDNEAGIGFLRADGTAKPEIEPFVRVARFLADHGNRLVGRALEDVAVVVPQSEVLSVRDQGTPATQRAVRALEYDLHVPVRVLSEYGTADLRRGARLLVLPSPRILTNSAWDALMAAVEAGSTLLITGPIDRDEYERPVARLAGLGVGAITRPVAPENRLLVDATTEVRVPFRGAKLERIERAVVKDAARARVEVIRRGKGKIVWCPLPVELSDDDRATTAVYRVALRVAGIPPAVTATAVGQGWQGPQRGSPGVPNAALALEWSGVGVPFSLAGDGLLVRPLPFKDSVLFVVVNETDTDASVRLPVPGAPQPVRVRVAAERAIMVLVDTRSGKVIGSTQ